MATNGQTVTGSWYGKADVVAGRNTNNYLSELILKQKGDEVEGIFGYYFRDGYQSFFVRGKYDKATRRVRIPHMPVTYNRATSIDGASCEMEFTGVFKASKVESSLDGSFIANPKYKYTCPELRISYSLDVSEVAKQDSLIKNSVTRKLWQPLPQDVVVSNTVPVRPTLATDTATAVRTVVAPEAAKMEEMKAAFDKRATVVNKEIEVASDSVRISFYDNGDIDGDSISVFLNKQPVMINQSLSAEALNIYVKLDSSKSVNEVVMFADNLGKIPPNTALMIVNDGVERHEVYLSSSLTQNAAVRLRKKKR